eukprot:989210-Amphidinium_carterae.1
MLLPTRADLPTYVLLARHMTLHQETARLRGPKTTQGHQCCLRASKDLPPTFPEGSCSISGAHDGGTGGSFTHRKPFVHVAL